MYRYLTYVVLVLFFALVFAALDSIWKRLHRCVAIGLLSCLKIRCPLKVEVMVLMAWP